MRVILKLLRVFLCLFALLFAAIISFFFIPAFLICCLFEWAFTGESLLFAEAKSLLTEEAAEDIKEKIKEIWSE